jgi:glycosyltransferase involved in cell wall biosynthesis
MKVAVYTIALNEEQFVKRWYESAKDADYLLIADTGSKDNTARLAQRLGINVVSIKVSPWRFDDARNAALALLPEDIDMCISLDMDEVLTPNWRPALEESWKKGITRPKYKHVWSWKDDGTPGLEFAYDHIHARHGFRWKYPVHETLFAYGLEETSEFITGLETHHRPDPSKSRSQYLPLLAMSVKEDPYSDRNAYYYARELFFYGKYEEAAEEFKRHLALPTSHWLPERASSLRYLAKCEPENAKQYLLQAIQATPFRREPHVELAKYAQNVLDWGLCLKHAELAISIAEKPLDYLCEEFAWGDEPFDLAAVASYYLGNKEKALAYGQKALDLAPRKERLSVNLSYYQA